MHLIISDNLIPGI